MASHALLVLAWVTLTAFAAPAYAQGRCGYAEIGNVTGEVSSTVERRMWPDAFTLELYESDMCAESEAVGLKVTACDADEAPHVFLLDAAHGVVVREGELRTLAYVYISIFCSDLGHAAYDYSEPTNLSSRLSPSLSTSWTGSSIGVATPPPQTLSTVPSDPPVTSSLQLLSTTSSVSESPQSDTESENSGNPVQLESRFSSISKDSLSDPLKGHPSPVSLTSRFKEPLPEQSLRPPIPTPEELSSLFKQGKASALEKLKRQFDSIRLYENETLTAPVLGQFDSYSSLMKKILSSYSKDPKSSWPSFGKRLSELRPGTTAPWLLNRSPAWLKRPAKRPSTSWLRQGFLPDWSTRKSFTRPRKRFGGHSMDDSEQWRPPYEEDALLLQSEEVLDPFPWWTENKIGKTSVAYRGEVPPPSRPSQSSIQHLTKKQVRYVPPLHEEDRTVSADWQDQLSKRSPLPKLLLLLQEPEHPPIMKMKCDSPHSVEDGEPWWPIAKSEHSDDGNLWQPDYPADYTADDGDSFSRSENDRNVGPLSHVMPPYKEQSGSPPSQWLERPPVPDTAPAFVADAPVAQWCPKCPPVNAIEERKQFRPRHSRVSNEVLSSSQMFRRPPHEQNPFGSPRIGHNLPNAYTERPVLSSTPRHATPSWAKSSKSPTQLQEALLSSVEQGEHPASAAHWNYLSKLLLSHPTFRDSTHVIRFK